MVAPHPLHSRYVVHLALAHLPVTPLVILVLFRFGVRVEVGLLLDRNVNQTCKRSCVSMARVVKFYHELFGHRFRMSLFHLRR